MAITYEKILNLKLIIEKNQENDMYQWLESNRADLELELKRGGFLRLKNGGINSVKKYLNQMGIEVNIEKKIKDNKSRYYIIYEKDTDAFVLEEAEKCIDDILKNNVYTDKSEYPNIIVSSNYHCFISSQLIKLFLDKYFLKVKNLEESICFCNKILELDTWNNFGKVLENWAIKNTENISCHSENDIKDILDFSCYIGCNSTKYAISKLTANKIFNNITNVNPEIIKELKVNGSGKLSKNVLELKIDKLKCTANDAFSTIDIVIEEESEKIYKLILIYLCNLLKEDFPKSYSIEFDCKNKNYLEIKGLPKNSVNCLFANTVKYENLHMLIEKYAHLSMKKFALYTNMPEEQSAMPGTFAVFALGLENEKYWPLVCDYLDTCDNGHSSIQEKFLNAFIEKNGFTIDTMPVIIKGIYSIQNFNHLKKFKQLVANEESLDSLIYAKENIKIYIVNEGKPIGNNLEKFIWNDVCYSIFGIKDNEEKNYFIESVSDNLKEKYIKILN